ncbi:MAG: hypothetical protein M3022_10755, partial [Actinomycetota bacterium]|nr:hypothetical protein [Actinomycetota bacterium]
IGAVGVATAGLAAAAAIVITGGSGGSAAHGASPRRAPARVQAIPRGTASVSSSVLSSAAARRRTAVQSRPRPDPGRLPQTARLPSARTHEFAVRMRGLWAAIVGAPTRTAEAAFFPEAAYVQLKSVGDPAGDFEYRLFYDYRLDIAAAHALLGVGAAASRLIRTSAVAGYAHWVPPGVCDNRVGYYEQPNTRLVYRENGQLRSIGIASLISWRGVWYVVHLGAILRGSAGGVVDAPSAGPGVSADAGTC